MPRPTKEQQREYNRKWIVARREKYLAGATCARCGRDRDATFELDHIDPALKVDHKIWSWSKERLEAELAKCQWLCRPCHVEKTAEDRLTDHGTVARYDRGCRCESCRESNNAKSRLWRSARPQIRTDALRARELANYHRRAARLTPEQKQERSAKALARYYAKKAAASG